MALSKDFMFERHQFVIFRKLFEGCTLEHNRFISNVVDDLSMNSKEAAADPALHALGLFGELHRVTRRATAPSSHDTPSRHFVWRRCGAAHVRSWTAPRCAGERSPVWNSRARKKARSLSQREVRPESGFPERPNIAGGMPPASRNHLVPIGQPQPQIACHTSL